ncbi:MAG: DNA-formamidopyrimidine glycosylase, partial [Candidatus Omnitrophica bacterium]|nr:DNA-formamidopyrimidine glycosylase [Candidatus Omnitrophota bacterium]
VNDIFKVEWLTDELKKRTAPIKPLLMNQNFLAGIGNIYASEILYRSKIHPQKSSKTLSMDEVRRLHKITTKVLKEAIALRGTSMRNYRDSDGKKGNYMNRIKVYGREGRECFACRTPVKRIVQTGRSTFFCEKCQT